MFQQVTIVGNLGRDPEMRYTAEGTPVTNMSVAVNAKWSGQDGVQHEQVTWFRISAWRRLAEVCNQYLTKGRQVMVIGTLRPDENGNPRIWTDNEGAPRASFELTAQTVKFLGGRGNGGGYGDEPGAPPEEGEEIPF